MKRISDIDQESSVVFTFSQIQISSNIWTKDLIPLLLQHSDNDDLFNTVVRLMMNLALPRKKMFIDRFNPEELYVELDKITGDPLIGCIKR